MRLVQRLLCWLVGHPGWIGTAIYREVRFGSMRRFRFVIGPHCVACGAWQR